MSGTRRWIVAVDGSERVQQGASGKYGMKVGKGGGEPGEYWRTMKVYWMVQKGKNGALES